MKRMNKLFLRKLRHSWFLQHGSSQVKLAENKAEAWARWHEIMAQGVSAKETKVTLKMICDQFSESIKSSRKPLTWQWYRYHIDILLFDTKGDTVAEEVRLSDVALMIHSKKHWKQNSRYNLAKAVKAIYNWAKKTD